MVFPNLDQVVSVLEPNQNFAIDVRSENGFIFATVGSVEWLVLRIGCQIEKHLLRRSERQLQMFNL